jgi:hypothetical protein
MKRTWTHRFLLVAALLHLFADVAAVGGAVFCVGPDDHRAVEFGHITPGCDAPGEAAESAYSEAIALNGGDSCTNCTDTALHEEAEIGTKRVSWDAPPAVLASPLQPQQLAALHTERRAPAFRPDSSATLRAHRSIVLII